jgi:hypothetical protein
LDVTSNGQLVVCGVYQGTKSFGETVLNRIGGSNGFIAKFETNGKMTWVKNTSGDNFSEFRKVTSDGAGNIYVAGSISGDVSLEKTSLTSTGDKDACVAKYDPKGNLLWVLQGGGSEDDECMSISSDPAGNCYTGGLFSSAATFGKMKVNGWAQQDIFISRIK